MAGLLVQEGEVSREAGCAVTIRSLAAEAGVQVIVLTGLALVSKKSPRARAELACCGRGRLHADRLLPIRCNSIGTILQTDANYEMLECDATRWFFRAASMA